MRIAGTEINLQHRAFEIYVSGCNPPHCPGCHNPELWDFSVGKKLYRIIGDILAKAMQLRDARLIDYIWILGGEPLDQDHDCLELLLKICRDIAPVVLWTHYDNIPNWTVHLVDYVKTGPYKNNSTDYIEPLFGIRLANLEQKIRSANEIACEKITC